MAMKKTLTLISTLKATENKSKSVDCDLCALTPCNQWCAQCEPDMYYRVVKVRAAS